MRTADPGVRLGVDVGSVRVGVAISDRTGQLASPLVTLPRAGSVDALAALVSEHGVVEVVVGLPQSLSGRPGPAEAAARGFAADLAARLRPVPVCFCDERFTTVLASRSLTRQGVPARRQRAVVDQAAAVVILQSWLDTDGGRRGRKAGDA
ncbi:MAG: Holliday junction resolvase RuvX [Actinomycetota bacterium]|nr:Holliday junction resolvase RuvX [Actinomycetota bacterium]